MQYAIVVRDGAGYPQSCPKPLFFPFYERGFIALKQTKTENEKIPVVREYKIGDMTYIVHAVTKDGVKEDAATKIRRMIQNDLRRVKKPEN